MYGESNIYIGEVHVPLHRPLHVGGRGAEEQNHGGESGLDPPGLGILVSVRGEHDRNFHTCRICIPAYESFNLLLQIQQLLIQDFT
ncbi:hypothetical protein XENOCAPTIV_025670 [Xenoophorus captivus]|uniref:Uncharacterized protein n=1 Tax=Xenoophorus captivus TaxID=1517983 RepID=A0ABV0R216_9TELE